VFCGQNNEQNQEVIRCENPEMAVRINLDFYYAHKQSEMMLRSEDSFWALMKIH
jgi:hypothetical protein